VACQLSALDGAQAHGIVGHDLVVRRSLCAAARSSLDCWHVETSDTKTAAYIWTEGLGGDLKVSLHGRDWRLGFTTEHTLRPDALAKKADRTKIQWDRTQPESPTPYQPHSCTAGC
jgi:hypothetical protein